jgi:hypothetical protein
MRHLWIILIVERPKAYAISTLIGTAMPSLSAEMVTEHFRFKNSMSCIPHIENRNRATSIFAPMWA